MKCQAMNGECDHNAYWRVIYRRGCRCWPRYKVFCPLCVVKMAEFWSPPDNIGLCPECSTKVEFDMMMPL